MSSIACNVVLLPEDDLSAKTIEASKKLEPYGTLFTIETGKFFPHLSVYMLQLKVEDVPKAKELLAGIAAKTGRLYLTATGYHQSHNYFDVEYHKTEQLSRLQDLTVTALNPIRDGMRENDKPRMTEATGLALENFKKYGWNTVGDLYRPHLTLTRFSKEQSNPQDYLGAASEFNGEFPILGLFESGENGTAIHHIASFNLI
jgi:hypothetical protein